VRAPRGRDILEPVTVAPDNTQELDVDDLVGGRPPPMPVPGPGAAPAPHAGDAGRASVYRKPWRRLFKAYFVTTQVVLSYVFLAVRQRFRSGEGAALLLAEAHRRNARRVEVAIVQLQGLFIKVGQLISIMANFLPEDFRRELQGLQDNVPPRPYKDIEARLREEFGGRPPDEVFAEFARTPVASASIGQVHLARLQTGEAVAVKVQYPDIDVIVATDLRALKRIFAVLRWFMPDWGFETIYGEIREMVLSELDYRQEANAIRTISANFKGRRDVLFPRVMGEHSTARVLVTEWMAGTKIADLDRLAAQGIDRRKAAGCASRPTASRSSSTACITPILTRGTSSCAPAAPTCPARPWSSWTSGPPPRSRRICARAWSPSSRGP